MKKIIQSSINHCCLLLALSTVIVFGCRCAAPPPPPPDPLAGWKMDFGIAPPEIEKDCHSYIQNLSAEEQKSAQVDGFFNDGKGQHVVKVEIALNGTWWDHLLFYDKNNKRFKVVKFSAGNYSS